MYRSKRLLILLAILAAACAAAFIALGWEQRQEQIKTSGEVVLEIPGDSVQSLAWTSGEETLSFHWDGTWVYDGDEAFPVDDQAMEALLEPFAAFSAAFVIEGVEDYGQYGLDDPVCAITIGTEAQTYEILLGDYSAMDDQRYVSFGDGNVYLAVSDPMDQYDAALRDCIRNDEIPNLDRVTRLRFSGAEQYTITYEENSDATYCPEDVYFTQSGSGTLPLDTGRVEGYLSDLQDLGLDDYVTYNATEEELTRYGLDEPELTVTADYTAEDGAETSGTFVLQLSRDPEERAQAEAASGETDDAGEETVTAYVRVGDSPIVYRITAQEYEALTAAARDDLRHREVLTADFDDVEQIDIVLEGETRVLTAQGSGEDRSWTYLGQEVEIDGLQSAVEALYAEQFTDEEPAQQLEIAFTVHLDNESFPQVEVKLYRYDGEFCLAEVDGVPICLVERAAVVELVEEVQGIVLQDYTEAG